MQKLLNVFEQRFFLDKQGTIKNYPYPIEDDVVGTIVKKLHHTGTDPVEKKLLEDEAELWRVFNKAVEGQAKELEQIIQEKNKALEEKDKALGEKDKALGERDKALEEKEKVIEEKDKEVAELRRRLGMK